MGMVQSTSILVMSKRFAINHDGKVFVGGTFENVAGIPAADCIAIWDPVPETWSALESNGQGYERCDINALAFDSEGQLYIGGGFTNWVGIQAADYLAMWKPDTQTWQALGSRNGEGVLNSYVQAIAIDRNDRVYAGGWFYSAADIDEADRVAMWDPESQTWSALGSHRNGGGALNSIVESLAMTIMAKYMLAACLLTRLAFLRLMAWRYGIRRQTRGALWEAMAMAMVCSQPVGTRLAPLQLIGLAVSTPAVLFAHLVFPERIS